MLNSSGERGTLVLFPTNKNKWKKIKNKKNKICVNGDFVEIGNGATDRFSKNMNLYLVKIKQVFKILLI